MSWLTIARLVGAALAGALAALGWDHVPPLDVTPRVRLVQPAQPVDPVQLGLFE
jgi:hypothetical protein